MVENDPLLKKMHISQLSSWKIESSVVIVMTVQCRASLHAMDTIPVNALVDIAV